MNDTQNTAREGSMAQKKQGINEIKTIDSSRQDSAQIAELQQKLQKAKKENQQMKYELQTKNYEIEQKNKKI